MKRKAIIPLALGLGIGLLTVKLAVDAIRKAQAANQNRETFMVIRAKVDIPAYEAIKPEMVEKLTIGDPTIAPAHDRVESPDDLKDDSIKGWRVAAKAIPAGSIVLKSMLASPGTHPGLTGRIPPGFRAVSVRIDEVTGVAYQLQPGDFVDVIVVMDIDSTARGRKETIAEVILQHVQVAAIGYDTDSSPSGSSASKVKPARSATLFVPEDEVPKLHLAGTRGKITLAMRGGDEQVADKGASATMGDVLKSPGNAPAASPKDEVPEWVKLLMAEQTKKSATAQNPDDEPVPHAVLVYRGSAEKKGGTSVEQITFESPDSAQIIAVQAGPPSSASAKIRSGARRPSARSSDLVSEPSSNEQ